MTKWDKDTFIKKAKTECAAHISNVILDLVKFTEEHADIIQWGKGAGQGTMRFKCKTDDFGILPLFEITTHGQINFLINSLRSKVRKREILRAYQLKLESNFMIDFSPEFYPSDVYHQVDDVFTIKHDVDKFVDTIQVISDRLHQ